MPAKIKGKTNGWLPGFEPKEGPYRKKARVASEKLARVEKAISQRRALIERWKLREPRLVNNLVQIQQEITALRKDMADQEVKLPAYRTDPDTTRDIKDDIKEITTRILSAEQRRQAIITELTEIGEKIKLSDTRFKALQELQRKLINQ